MSTDISYNSELTGIYYAIPAIGGFNIQQNFPTIPLNLIDYQANITIPVTQIIITSYPANEFSTNVEQIELFRTTISTNLNIVKDNINIIEITQHTLLDSQAINVKYSVTYSITDYQKQEQIIENNIQELNNQLLTQSYINAVESIFTQNNLESGNSITPDAPDIIIPVSQNIITSISSTNFETNNTFINTFINNISTTLNVDPSNINITQIIQNTDPSSVSIDYDVTYPADNYQSKEDIQTKVNNLYSQIQSQSYKNIINNSLIQNNLEPGNSITPDAPNIIIPVSQNIITSIPSTNFETNNTFINTFINNVSTNLNVDSNNVNIIQIIQNTDPSSVSIDYSVTYPANNYESKDEIQTKINNLYSRIQSQSYKTAVKTSYSGNNLEPGNSIIPESPSVIVPVSQNIVTDYSSSDFESNIILTSSFISNVANKLNVEPNNVNIQQVIQQTDPSSILIDYTVTYPSNNYESKDEIQTKINNLYSEIQTQSYQNSIEEIFTENNLLATTTIPVSQELIIPVSQSIETSSLAIQFENNTEAINSFIKSVAETLDISINNINITQITQNTSSNIPTIDIEYNVIYPTDNTDTSDIINHVYSKLQEQSYLDSINNAFTENNLTGDTVTPISQEVIIPVTQTIETSSTSTEFENNKEAIDSFIQTVAETLNIPIENVDITQIKQISRNGNSAIYIEYDITYPIINNSDTSNIINDVYSKLQEQSYLESINNAFTENNLVGDTVTPTSNNILIPVSQSIETSSTSAEFENNTKAIDSFIKTVAETLNIPIENVNITQITQNSSSSTPTIDIEYTITYPTDGNETPEQISNIIDDVYTELESQSYIDSINNAFTENNIDVTPVTPEETSIDDIEVLVEPTEEIKDPEPLDLTLTFQIKTDVKVFNNKIGLFKDSSNQTIVKSLFDISNQTFPITSIKFDFSELLPNPSVDDVISLGGFKTMYSDFKRTIANYYEHPPDGTVSLFDTDAENTLNEQFVTVDEFISIIQDATSQDSDIGADVSGNLQIYQINSVLETLYENDPFNNRQNRSIHEGFIAGDLILLTSGISIRLDLFTKSAEPLNIIELPEDIIIPDGMSMSQINNILETSPPSVILSKNYNVPLVLHLTDM